MRVSAICGAALGAVILIGCGEPGRDKKSGQVPALQAELMQVHDAPGAPGFSGRVPSLSSADMPRETLRMGRQFGDSTSFGLVSGIQPVGQYLVLTDRLMSQHIAVVDRETGAITARFGRHGKGPKEFLDPSWVLADPESPGRVWIYDFQNRRFTRVRLNASPDSTFGELFPIRAGQALERPVITDRHVISNGLFADYSLLMMDAAGKPLSRLVANPPFSTTEIENWTGRRLLNRSFLAVNPSRTRLALAYQWKSRIDFFDINGARLGSIAGPRQTTAKYRVQNDRFFWDPEGEMAYTAIRATERYVYAAFCGCPEMKGEEQVPDRLHIFRWNGDFVAEVGLDRKIFEFNVTEDDQVLYASVSEPYPFVGEWRMPAWLTHMTPQDHRPSAGSRRAARTASLPAADPLRSTSGPRSGR